MFSTDRVKYHTLVLNYTCYCLICVKCPVIIVFPAFLQESLPFIALFLKKSLDTKCIWHKLFQLVRPHQSTSTSIMFFKMSNQINMVNVREESQMKKSISHIFPVHVGTYVGCIVCQDLLVRTWFSLWHMFQVQHLVNQDKIILTSTCKSQSSKVFIVAFPV